MSAEEIRYILTEMVIKYGDESSRFNTNTNALEPTKYLFISPHKLFRELNNDNTQLIKSIDLSGTQLRSNQNNELINGYRIGRIFLQPWGSAHDSEIFFDNISDIKNIEEITQQLLKIYPL